MKKILTKGLVLTISLFSLLLLSPSKTLADGMIINPDKDRFDYTTETSQKVYINYENKTEKLIISIGLEKFNKDQLWLFPIPGNPEKTIIDVLDSLPNLSGEKVDDKAKSNVADLRTGLQATQLYTIPYLVTTANRSTSYDKGFTGTENLAASLQAEQDVVVHEHLEKSGITSEIITAKTANGLYEYFKAKNLKIEKGTIPVLDTYIGKDYTFVASWITPQATTEENESSVLLEENQTDSTNKSSQGSIAPRPYLLKSLMITFPGDKIYFPLMPTSVYQSKTIPISIRVIGFVSPKVYADIKNYAKTDYFIGSSYGYTEAGQDTTAPSFYYPKEQSNIKYTRIEINAPSKLLTEDLWFDNNAPAKANYNYQWAKLSGGWLFSIGVILLLIFSYFSSILASLIIFKEARGKMIWRYGLLGLFNVLTIISFIIASIFWRTKTVKKEDQQVFDEIKKRGYSTRALQIFDVRKFLYVPLFSAIFVLLAWGITRLIELTF